MTEQLLQFIWGFGYFNRTGLTTTAGEKLTIISPGLLNKNQGPDFSAAKIKVENTLLAGTVELHIKTSEWKKHRHENDQHYKSVILHVVLEHDEEVNDVPVLELSSRISNLLLERYSFLMSNRSFMACGQNISTVQPLAWLSWKERLLAQRLTRKSMQVLEMLKASNFHWEETFWWLLARNMGGKVNADAFEAVARSIPVNLLAKHKSSIHQLEALLLGQANLLHEDIVEEYPKMLRREYLFLQKKHSLRPSPLPVLFLRMRPGNFPTVRLAQLAMLIHTNTHLFSKIVAADNLAEITGDLAVTANDFWHYHYTLKEASSFKKKTLGEETVHHLVINTIVPVVYAYGVYHKDEKAKEKALRWLEELPAEGNSITKEFSALGVQNENAFDSQALIELKNEYCHFKKCLQCSVGANLLKEAAHDYTPANRL